MCQTFFTASDAIEGSSTDGDEKIEQSQTGELIHNNNTVAMSLHICTIRLLNSYLHINNTSVYTFCNYQFLIDKVTLSEGEGKGILGNELPSTDQTANASEGTYLQL